MHRRSRLSRTIRSSLSAALLVVSLGTAFAQRNAATVEVQIGQVSVLKDGNPVALFVGQGIVADQIVVTGADSYAKFRVSDGSEFEVFEKSQVTFRDTGGSWKDLLNVWLGRVKVHVQHLLGPNPTSVTSPTAIISVRGTVFDVLVENAEGDTIVSVDDGAVAVQHRLFPRTVVPILHPGESIHVFHDQQLMGQQIQKGGIMQKVFQQVEKGIWDYIRMHPGGSGGGSPLPGGSGAPGAQGDGKGKNGPAGGKNPPGGGSPPAPPTPPGGGGGE